MIGLASRLAVSGGRESVVRLALTALGVAVATTLLLLAAAADPAIRAQQRHQAWRWTYGTPPEEAGPVRDPLLWLLSDDAVDGRAMRRLEVAATGPASPVPLGLPRVPRDGEVFVSPSLARLLDELPADRLGDRFPGPPPGLVPRSFLAGPGDLVAVVGRDADALRREGAVRVARVNTTPQDFGFTDFLRLVFAIGAVGLILPVLVFVSTSTRLGAARREQRFAALRLAGATPGQTNLVAAVEAAASGLVGVLGGTLGYLLLRPLAAHLEIDGHPSFVEDVRVSPILLAAVVVLVPLLAVAVATWSLRRLQISPLGVARRAPRPRPTVRRLVPLAVGSTAFVLTLAFGGTWDSFGTLALVALTFAAVILGIVVAGPWLTVVAAGALDRFAASTHPAALLAGRRLEDDPATGFRAVSGLVLAVFVATVFSGVTPALVAEGGARQAGLVAPSTIVAPLPAGATTGEAARGVDVAIAAGARRGALAHHDPDPPDTEQRAHGVTTVLVACGDLALLQLEREPGCTGAARVEVLTFVKESAGVGRLRAAPSLRPLDEVASLPVEYLVVTTDGGSATTDRVRTALQRALPGSVPWLGREASTRDNSRLVALERIADLGLVISLVIAGCGLAVAVAGGIVERKRPFALLRLSGMHLRELQGVALLEASAPLVLIAVATAALGLAVSAAVVQFAGGIPWKAPTLGYWASLTGGLLVSLAVAAATLPLLGPTTAPSAVRFE